MIIVISTIIFVTSIMATIVIIIISIQCCYFLDSPATSRHDCSSIDKRRDECVALSNVCEAQAVDEHDVVLLQDCPNLSI